MLKEIKKKLYRNLKKNSNIVKNHLCQNPKKNLKKAYKLNSLYHRNIKNANL